MQFLLLLVVTLAVSVGVAAVVLAFFRKPIDRVFTRILGSEISSAWRKFLTFALFVVGVSSGVNVGRLEEFLRPIEGTTTRPALTPEYWGLEIYRTVIQTLGGMAWALLLFFIAALVAFVVVRRGEMKTGRSQES